jgi:Ca2+-transporting ATPase
MTKPPRPADDDLITPWLLARWLAVGAYVGAATVGIFAAWYVSPPWLASLGLDPAADGHTPVSWHQLRHWSTCGEWAKADGFAPAPFRLAGGGIVGPFASPCDVFGAAGKAKASTLSLSVLVAIEMFNALNALSEDCSLLSVPPWANPWLLAAMGVSFGLHALILYVPPLARMFAVVPLSRPEVALVLAFAAPVILIDECLKGVGRWRWRQSRAAAKAEAEALASPPASPARGRGRAGAGAAGGARRRVKAVA